MSQSNCPQCGAPATAGASACEFCGASLLVQQAAAAAPPSNEAVIAAERWMAKLDGQELANFLAAWEQTRANCDNEECEEWLNGWQTWLAGIENERPDAPNQEYADRMELLELEWLEALETARSQIETGWVGVATDYWWRWIIAGVGSFIFFSILFENC